MRYTSYRSLVVASTHYLEVGTTKVNVVIAEQDTYSGPKNVAMLVLMQTAGLASRHLNPLPLPASSTGLGA